jgi:hypothetical protein
MAYIHMYTGSVTAGGTDGTAISENTGASPLSVGPLLASSNEVSSAIKMAVRCDAGYLTVGNTTITPTGTTAAKWALAPDSAGSPGAFGAYGAALTVSSVINATNTIFWVRAKATSDENPVNDVSVDLQIDATIAAV